MPRDNSIKKVLVIWFGSDRHRAGSGVLTMQEPGVPFSERRRNRSCSAEL